MLPTANAYLFRRYGLEIRREGRSRVNFAVGLLATMTIALFFVSTVVVKARGVHGTVAQVKSPIVVPGLFVLMPAIVVTGGTAFALSRRWQGLRELAHAGHRHSGLLILVPAAIVLDGWPPPTSSARASISYKPPSFLPAG